MSAETKRQYERMRYARLRERTLEAVRLHAPAVLRPLPDPPAACPCCGLRFSRWAGCRDPFHLPDKEK